MLKGEAKTNYQRKYMKERRLKLKLNRALVRPKTLKVVRPFDHRLLDRLIAEEPSKTVEFDADGNVIYEEG